MTIITATVVYAQVNQLALKCKQMFIATLYFCVR